MKNLEKYNIQVPRYTSYPTVPYWENNLTESLWSNQIKKSFLNYNNEGISLYIHLPFCESLCTYCACNTRITVNHKVEEPYINAVLNEWQLYRNLFNAPPLIKEIHLGGGTPTFFSPVNLKRLISEILKDCIIAQNHDFSFEGHPSNTTVEHLQTLFNLGFKRVSFGIQDFDEKVQIAINRFQTVDEVKNVVNAAKKIGYNSINFDLVYGLPFQTPSSVLNTINEVIKLMPDRIAYYSYAHVPWIKPGQRRYTEKDIPKGADKKTLYTLGQKLFTNHSYKDIGMDHFALPNDELFIAYESQQLHRNFMGYTTNTTKLLVGLGCSAISDCRGAYSQNIKDVETYIEKVNSNLFPIHKGHILSDYDLKIKDLILNIMCKGEFKIDSSFDFKHENLMELVNDNLIEIKENSVVITPIGKSYLRNIALVFDKRFWDAAPTNNTFSLAI